MRKLLARVALGAGLALIVGSPRAADSGVVFQERRPIDVQWVYYDEESPSEPGGRCHYSCTVEVTTSDLVMDGDGNWRRVETTSYDGEPVSKPGNADEADCRVDPLMAKLPECPSYQ